MYGLPYGDIDDVHARARRAILSDANVRQNVTDATHNRGNIIDLINTSTSSSPITRVSVARQGCFGLRNMLRKIVR